MHLACSMGKSFTICLVSGREWKAMEEKKKVEEKRKRKYVFRCKWKDKLKKLNIFYTFILLIYKEIRI